jgi:hypothetical protein
MGANSSTTSKETIMRNIIFAATAALILAAGTAPSLAAHGNKGAAQAQAQALECATILAEGRGPHSADLEACQGN